MTADDITVSREYFLTLLRRAEHAYETQTKDTVEIPISEYDSLRHAVHEYEALKNALVTAGTPIESIQVLINASGMPAPPHVKNESSSEGSESDEVRIPAPGRGHTKVWTRSLDSQTTKADDKWTTTSDPNLLTPVTIEDTCGEEALEGSVQAENHFASSHEERSLILRGLPVTTVLSDVIKAIRGGLLMNMFLRSTYRTAHVAFLEPAAAWQFFKHVKQNDLYIKGKRVDVDWDQRQNYLPGRIARQVYCQGATRNLVIRFPSKEVTAEVIRDDLEHIHCLEVVDIAFRDGHAWISLNSISHALNARSCMGARKRYKGSRIEFWPDECAQPLPAVVERPEQHNKAAKSKRAAMASHNRFGAFLLHNNDEDSNLGAEP